MTVFVIEDEWHAEWIGEFATRAEAEAELDRLAAIPWDEPPNQCPCGSWRKCGRRYHLIEFDAASEPWRRLTSEAFLEVSAKETKWLRTST